TFREGTYSYPERRTAHRGVNLSIEPGRTTGIVGRSGAGKSTIAEMLLRLRTPTSGTIELGGVRTDAFDIADWRRRITFVPQDARIWHRTIRENIEFLRPGFTQDDIERAARLAMLHDEILQLPDGYETVLGVRSRGLSGGQRQRLSIARALLSQPWLIVLDEPTSALDAHSERDLQAALSGLRGSVTMVVIAHRLSTLALCDDLIVLDAGRVVAQGERETVMRQATFFSDREGEDFMYLDGE
ncbi:MAG: ATP-binding cassette domain-containing protein, partial [Ilumatobacteraceae bacterium]